MHTSLSPRGIIMYPVNNESCVIYRLTLLSLVLILLLLPWPSFSSTPIRAQLIIHENDANNIINKAFELGELGTTDVVYQGKQFVYWSPSVDFKSGGSKVTFFFGQKDISTGKVQLLKRLVLSITIPTLSVTSKQIDVVIHSIGNALNFLPDPPRSDVEQFFISHGIPIHKGSILDEARFEISDNDVAIAAQNASLTSQVTEESIIITAEVDLDVVSDSWQLARNWRGSQNWFDYKILSKNGVEHEVVALQARMVNKINILGQAYSGRTKTFDTANLRAGSFDIATTLSWYGTWDDGKGTVSTTQLYFVGTLKNGNDYIQFYSNPFSFLAIYEWQYIPLNINHIAN